MTHVEMIEKMAKNLEKLNSMTDEEIVNLLNEEAKKRYQKALKENKTFYLSIMDYVK